MSSPRRPNVFEHPELGHGSDSVSFDEGLLDLLLRGGGSGLPSSQVLNRSAVVSFSFDSRPQSEEGRDDIGRAGVSDEILDPLLLAEALHLDRVLSSTGYNPKEELSSSVV